MACTSTVVHRSDDFADASGDSGTGGAALAAPDAGTPSDSGGSVRLEAGDDAAGGAAGSPSIDSGRPTADAGGGSGGMRPDGSAGADAANSGGQAGTGGVSGSGGTVGAAGGTGGVTATGGVGGGGGTGGTGGAAGAAGVAGMAGSGATPSVDFSCVDFSCPCPTDFRNCDLDWTNGCETPRWRDENCDTCGDTCPPGEHCGLFSNGPDFWGECRVLP